jgi:hypothetical protein
VLKVLKDQQDNKDQQGLKDFKGL